MLSISLVVLAATPRAHDGSSGEGKLLQKTSYCSVALISRQEIGGDFLENTVVD